MPDPHVANIDGHRIVEKPVLFGAPKGNSPRRPSADKPEASSDYVQSHAERGGSGQQVSRGVLIDCMRRVQDVEFALASVRGTLAGVCEVDAPTNGQRCSGRPQSRFNTVPDGISKAVATELRLPPAPMEATTTEWSAPLKSPEAPLKIRPSQNTRPNRNSARLCVCGNELMKDSKFCRKCGKSPQPKYLVDQIVIDSVNAHESSDLNQDGLYAASSGMTKMLRRASSMLAGKDLPRECAAVGKPPGRLDFVVEKTCWGWLKIPVGHPEAKFRLFWLMLGFVFIVCEAYLIPYYICFGVTAEGFFLGFVYCANTYFILDIPGTFLCGYLDENGLLISSPSKIAGRYLRCWLIPDLVAGIPWEWIDVNEDTASFTKSLRFVRAFRLLRLTRLLRLMKMKSFMENVEIFIESNQGIVFTVGVGKVLALLFAFTHWAACAWYVLGARGSDTGQTWLEWKVGDYPLSLETVHQKYTYALYFSLTTMTTVGYGDITPQNYDEVCFAIMLLGMASIVFAMLMGVLTDLIGNLNNQSHVRAEKKVLLSRYMHWRAVPRSLWMSIRQHLIFLWDTNEGYDAYEEEIKELLPPVLKTELCYHVYGRILHSAPFFMWMKNYTCCCKQLASMAQSVFLSKGDHIFRMGQENIQIYMLLAGIVRLSRNERHDSQDSEVFGPDDGAKGFHIPRKKEGNVMDLGAAAADIAKSTLRSKRKEVHQAAHIVKLMAPMKSGTRMSNLTSTPFGGEVTDVKPIRASVESRTGGRARGPNCAQGIFDSEVLRDAENMLMRQDAAEQKAARLMQVAWRRKRELRARLEAEGETEKGCDHNFTSVKSAASVQSRARTKFDQMPSRTVEAPAYFGESCLWVPYADWDVCAPPKYTYTATCEMRSELVYIPRSAVQEIIVRYSPWLEERFEYFRESVVRGLQSTAPGGSSNPLSMTSPCELVDWASVDAAMTFGEQEGALQVEHRQALVRAPQQPLREDQNDGPAMPRTFSLGPNGKAINMSAREWVRQGSKLSSGLSRDPR